MGEDEHVRGASDAAHPVRAVAEADDAVQPVDESMAMAFTSFAMEVLGAPGSAGERHLRSIASVLPIVVWAVDEDRRFTTCFGGGQRRLGLDDDVLVGQPITVFGELGAEAVERVVAEASPHAFMATGETDGAPWQFWNLVTPVPESRRVMAISLDTTDQYVTAERLEAHSRINRSVAEALRDSEERFRLLATAAPIGIFVLAPDASLLYANPQVREQTGRTLEDLLSPNGAFATIHPDDRPQFIDAVRRLFDDHEPLLAEYRIVRPDGSLRWVRVRISALLDEQGAAAGAVGSSADVTDHRVAEERLAEREERLRAIVETAAEGIVTTDGSGTILEFNAAAERIFGVDSDQVIGRLRWTDLLAPEVRDGFQARFESYLSGASPTLVGLGTHELPGWRADGTPVPIELAVTEVTTGEGRLFTGVLRDISERLEFEHRLEHMATHDPATGLANRVLFRAQLEDALERARRTGRAVSVLFVEIDRLAPVIESLGHEAGDELIRVAAERIERALEAPIGFTTLARIGTATFAVAVEDLDDVTEVVGFATAIVEAVNEPFEVAGDEAFVDATVGIAAGDDPDAAETLIANAALAMGRARTSSVARYEVFDEDMRGAVEHRRRTELALRRGRERDELVLHYQPVIHLDDERVVGVEALLRWRHPERGLVGPNEFIPVAEDSGLIVPIGAWVLRQACEQLAAWQDALDVELSVAINLSARQLTEPDLADVVATVLAETGARPDRVTFELTETMLLADAAIARRTLDELKATGVRIALDDFGTGYSSLTYLLDFPIDVVKVDRSFVQHVDESSRDRSIVAAVLSLASTLELDVVAEGVETTAQADALRSLGCTYGQGFLFARPMPADELAGLLDHGSRP